MYSWYALVFPRFLAFPCFHTRLFSFFLKNHISPSLLKRKTVSLGTEFYIGNDSHPLTLPWHLKDAIILSYVSGCLAIFRIFLLVFDFQPFCFDVPRCDFHYIYFARISWKIFSLWVYGYQLENSQLLFLPHSLLSFFGVGEGTMY